MFFESLFYLLSKVGITRPSRLPYLFYVLMGLCVACVGFSNGRWGLYIFAGISAAAILSLQWSIFLTFIWPRIRYGRAGKPPNEPSSEPISN
jgi:hypothetical protein